MDVRCDMSWHAVISVTNVTGVWPYIVFLEQGHSFPLEDVFFP